MITRDVFWEIHRLQKVDRLTPGQIGRQLGLSEKTVRHWLGRDAFSGRSPRAESSVLDRHKPRVKRLLDRHPYTAVQIMQFLAADGFEGSYNTVRRYVNEIRPPRHQAFLELLFEPGEAAQIDFGSCGLVPCGGAMRRLSVCMIVLCHSRLMHAEFMPCERLEHFLTCQRNAFEMFGGVPGRMIVDNCKCAVLRHGRHGHVQFNPRYADFAGHYGFEPVACNVRSPHEKGRVENGIGYLRRNFLAGRAFGSLAEAGTALRDWLDNTANVRVHGQTGERPRDRFEKSEAAALRPLPALPADCARVEARRADSRCRVFFDGNGYSVPERCAGMRLTLKAEPETVRIYDREDMVARHARCYDRNKSIVDPDHRQGMRLLRRRAREQNLVRDFLALGSAAEVFRRELENRQIAPRTHLRRIMALAEMHGSEPVHEALESAIEYAAFRAEYIEHLVLQRKRGARAQSGALHVPRAGDLLDLRVEEPDMTLYSIDE